MRELVIASHNKDKIYEFSVIFPQFKIRGAYEFNLSEPEENGQDFKENALIKAQYFFNQTGIACLADDSGLSVCGLNNMPGVFSARWAINKDFKPAMNKIQALLGDNPNRQAFFSCALCYYDAAQQITTQGETHGQLVFPARGTMGFGYDAIFVADGADLTFGEMTIAQKNKYSHRIKAINQLIKLLAL